MKNEFCVGNTKCFWCGEMDAVLIGQRPMSEEKCNGLQGIVTSYEPCQKCQEGMDQGFTLIECTDYPNAEDQPEIQKGVYPTGKMWVVKTEVANELGIDTSHGRAYIDPEASKKIGLYDLSSD